TGAQQQHGQAVDERRDTVRRALDLLRAEVCAAPQISDARAEPYRASPAHERSREREARADSTSHAQGGVLIDDVGPPSHVGVPPAQNGPWSYDSDSGCAVQVDRQEIDESFTPRSEEHTSELQSRFDLVCRLLLEKKKHKITAFAAGKRALALAAMESFSASITQE